MKATPYIVACKMTVVCSAIMQQIVRHVHLASIDVKSEDSILLKETMIVYIQGDAGLHVPRMGFFFFFYYIQ